MWTMLWPLLLIVGSNVAYHLIAKSTPGDANTFLSLTITYLTGAAAAFGLFLATSGGKSLTAYVGKLNWTSWVLGLVIIGLETGSLYLYRVGWSISVGSLIANIALAVILAMVGVLVYRETLSASQIFGMICCVAGLFFLNKK